MVEKIISKGKKLLSSPQSSVLSAATIIMFMIVASRVLGLVRQMILLEFFPSAELSLFFAAFRLPDTIFEILVFGTFSSAFIPVFAKAVKKDKPQAWEVAGSVANLGLIIFFIFAFLIGVFADNLYAVFAPGYTVAEREQIVQITRVLLGAQAFFVISYVLTGVLESLKRFLVPALAPLFYNLGIILGTVLLSERLGLMGPTLGVLIGAFSHFLIQLPLAVKLGFRINTGIKITEEVKKIGKLAAPRVLEITFLQASKFVELFLASLISTASYAYFYLGNSLQLLPVGLFGTSIAKAALPTLSAQSEEIEKFKKTLWDSLNQMIFLVLPLAAILIVLRIPVVRLVYGRELFDWESTVQTGLVVSAFGFGIVFQAAISLLARAFYALHDTKTPVAVSIFAMLIIISLDFVFVRGLSVGVWGLAAAFSIGSAFQATALYVLVNKRVGGFSTKQLISPIKSATAAFGSGVVMYFLLKIFDRSVWVKRLSFLQAIETRNLPFERFVLDTRYTFNLLILTVMVSLIGLGVYAGIAILLRSKEVGTFFSLVKRILVKRKVSPIPAKESETVTPPPTDSTTN